MSEPSPGMSVTKGVTLVRHFGSGAMGSVWLADHDALKTQVVVKFMARALVNDEASVARFSREAAAASQVKSPHVVQMLDHGATPDGQPFIIMEHLEGQDLGTYLTIVGRVEPRIALSIVTQTARALSRAHEAGVIHRDIKPDNLFLADTGDGDVFVKVLDFGVAKAPGLESGGRITTTGNAVGTPCYMSPEQMLGASNLDSRADLWALAVVTFEMLTGVVPFAGDSPASLAIAIGKGKVPPLTALAPNLPRAVDDWFRKACQRDPNARFANARELASALASALEGAVDGPAAKRTQIVARGAASSGPFDVTQADTQVGSLMSVTATMPDMPDMPDMPATVPERTPELLDSVAATTSERRPTLAKKKSRAGLAVIPVLVLVLVAAAGALVARGRRHAKAPAPPIAPVVAEAPATLPEPDVDAAAAVPMVTASEAPPPPKPAAAARPTTHPKPPNVVKRTAPAPSTYDDIK